VLEIHEYTETDTERIGVLIADSYGEFNLADMTPERRDLMLGPFAFARSPLAVHREAISDAISAPSVSVAEERGEIVGVLRGGRTDGKGRTVLSSLFVSGQHHRRGIGRALVERFERQCATRGVKVFRVSATVYAIPFYSSVGYRKSTGLRSTSSFGQAGLIYQPMKKTLDRSWVGDEKR
jgi:GNAT superfamily N-acetyltransferase